MLRRRRPFYGDKMTEKEIDHAARNHASIAPSAIDQYLHCLGSFWACKDMPERKSEHTGTGTFAHEITEVLEASGLDMEAEHNAAEIDGIIQDLLANVPEGTNDSEKDDLALYPYQFVCYTQKLELRLEPFAKHVEEKVEISKDIWGTLDRGYAYRTDKHDALAIVDYKHGTLSVAADKEIEVDLPVIGETGELTDVSVHYSLKGNPQIAAYMLGYINLIRQDHPNFDPAYATGVIYQPRVPNEKAVRQYRYSREELKEWSRLLSHLENVLAAKAVLPFKAGKWCQFCKFKPKCPMVQDRCDVGGVITSGTSLTPNQLTDDQVRLIVERSDEIRSFLKACASYALQRHAQDDPIEGLKIVEGRSQRRWSSGPKEVQKGLATYGIDAIELVPKLKGIGKIEKALADKQDKKKFRTAKERKEVAAKILAEWTDKPAGAPKIALVTDRRPGIALDPETKQSFVRSTDMLGEF